MKEGYIKKSERKNILFLADDCRIPSGIGTMTREIIIGNAHRFNFFQVGAAIKHPEAGQIFDLSADVNNQVGIDDSCVFVYPFDGYGNPDIVRGLLDKHNIDAIIHFTDPRYWQWLYGMSAELRQRVPIIYYHIWDDLPAPHYNKPFYESCDLLMGISKQSNNIAKMVLGKGNYVDLDGIITKADVSDHRSKVCYIPHGVNTSLFFPVPYSDTEVMRGELFGKDHAKDVNFVVFHNNRNIRRKMTSDLILSFKLMYDALKKENVLEAEKIRLVLHTDALDENGTDLPSVIKNVCPEIEHLVVITNRKVSPQDLNIFYNIADVVPNIASNEGWGLSSTEAMIVGKPIVNNVTGGLQDQCRFVDNATGKWLDFNDDFGSNHSGKHRAHGKWVYPVFPSTISIQGSPVTPYIFDDRCDVRDVAKAIMYWYSTDAERRKECGLAGREWAMSEEAGFTSAWMCQRIGDVMTLLMENWKPIPRFKLYDVEVEIKKTKNKPTGISL